MSPASTWTTNFTRLLHLALECLDTLTMASIEVDAAIALAIAAAARSRRRQASQELCRAQQQRSSSIAAPALSVELEFDEMLQCPRATDRLDRPARDSLDGPARGLHGYVEDADSKQIDFQRGRVSMMEA